jgi:membrane protein required for colicin V production
MVIDIMLVITLLYGFYLGFSKGIISTVLSVVSLLFGVMAALKFGPATTDFLEKAFDSKNPLMFLAGMLLTFVVVMIIIRMIARTMEGLLKTANINIVNQLLGGMLLSSVLIVLFSVLVWFGDQARVIDAQTKQTSVTYGYIEDIPGQAKDLAYRFKPMFEDFWNSSMDMMDRLEGMSIEQSESKPQIYDIEDDEPSKDSSN